MKYLSEVENGEKFNFDDKFIYPDFKDGPLSEYRNRASFAWKKLKSLLNEDIVLNLQHKIWKFMENNSEFQRPQDSQSVDQIRRLTMRRMFTYLNEGFVDENTLRERPDLLNVSSFAAVAYDASFSFKTTLSYILFPYVLEVSGTERLQKYVDALNKREIIGCFALTEISHGSNAKDIRTTVTYDPSTEEFIINTPDFEAAKCWVGNLGKTCTHAILFAKLITPDGVNQGLNAFFVPIRNTKTLEALPGVTVGDLGEKVGLNGIDNGFVMFSNYRFPRENLLARMGDVTPEGKYESMISDPRKRFGAILSPLSSARINICGIAYIFMNKAITIALRYSACRKQFGPDDSDKELPVLEYQAQQSRLIPYLASTFAIGIFSRWLCKVYEDCVFQVFAGESDLSSFIEIHTLSSAAKAICTWAARDAIQECREACGGHGYLKASGLGELRNDNDAGCTYEGENNILIQQASNWLLSKQSKGYDTFKTCSPLKSAEFLANFNQIISNKFKCSTINDITNPDKLMDILDWLCCYILKQTSDKVNLLKTQGKSSFDVRNESQTFNAKRLSLIYGERMIFYVFYKFIQTITEIPERTVLTKLLSLFGLGIVIKNIDLLYRGEYIIGSKCSELCEEGILDLIRSLKDDSIALVDSIAFPDFILNSVLGMSDGDIYKHIQKAVFTAPGALERPTWWKDVTYRDYLKTKL